jgi:hypothetical protein
MGKYSRLSGQRPPPPPPWKIHPVWRGLGCLLILIGPVLAYITADILVAMTMKEGWYPVPAELARVVRLPLIEINVPHFFANMLVAALLLLFGFALIMILYTVIFAIAGPGRYGPLDAPPVRERPRRSR